MLVDQGGRHDVLVDDLGRDQVQWIKVVLRVDRTKDMRAKVLEGVARNLMRVSLA